ncbi:MAG: DNA primase [Gammaproteobacteria bacterium]
MAGRIPQQFIDDLLNQADIIDVIDSRVALKKRGKEYIACCPFHNEKTPSFTVSQNKQFYHCFGCGAHGTALGFIMEYERLDFIDAIEALAAEYHIEVPREQGHSQQQDNKKPIYQILEAASQLYQQQLKTASKAVDYLKNRGLSGEISKTFGLGYAPDSWDFMLQQLGATPEQIQGLMQAGLLIEKTKDRHYDRFRDRIMFPIRDRRGRVIGFGGRIIDQGEPKYLNSPETPVFHKGQELYGLYEARQAVRDLTRLIIVEGYMDVVALAQNGIAYSVATLGTATSKEQVEKLFRIVPELIFCFDGDQAGRKAAWRALENSLPVLRDGVQARFLFLPDGEDPDSLVRKEGQQAFEQRLQSATPLSEFLLDSLSESLDLSSVDARSRLAEKAKPLISRLPDGVFKDLLTDQLAQRVGMTRSSIQSHMPRQESASTQQYQARQTPRHQITITPGRLAIALLLQYPDLGQQQPMPDSLNQSPVPGTDLLLSLYQTILQSQSPSPSNLLERWRGQKEFSILSRLLEWDIPDTDNEAQKQQLFTDALNRLQQQHREQRLEVLIEKSHQTPLTLEEKNELRELSVK